MQRSPEEDISFLSRQLFCWFNKIVSLGHKRPLAVDDLYNLNEEMSAERLEMMWNKYWTTAHFGLLISTLFERGSNLRYFTSCNEEFFP